MSKNNKGKDDLFNAAACDLRIGGNESLRKLAEKEEPKFLNILLKNKECLMDTMGFGIKPGQQGHFWLPKTRALYNIIFSYYDKYKSLLTRTAIDSVMSSMSTINGKTISEEDKTNIRVYWDVIWSTNTSPEDYEMLRNHINDRYVQWQAYEILRAEMDGLIKSTDGQSDIVKNIKERFYEIENLDADPYCQTVTIKDGLVKVMENLKDKRDNPEKITSVYTGINAIDKIYHGFNYGSYNIISGMINGGKTTLMFNIAFNMAKAGYGVVYISMEKEAIPFYTRLLCLHALVDYNRTKVGGKGEKGLSDYYYGKLEEAAKDLTETICPNLVCIQLAPEVTKLSKIIAETEKVKTKMKIDVLVVDYLGVIGFETNHPNRPDLDEALVSKRLQAYGRINHFVTITATQLKTSSSKEIRGKSKKATSTDDPSKVEVNSEDMSGSKMIIADADNGLGIILNSDSPATKAFVFGTKARDDQSRAIMVLDFDGKVGRISDPLLEPGQVTEIDQVMYNNKITEKDLESEDGLFDECSKSQAILTATKKMELEQKQQLEQNEKENKKALIEKTENISLVMPTKISKELEEVTELAKEIQSENSEWETIKW